MPDEEPDPAQLPEVAPRIPTQLIEAAERGDFGVDETKMAQLVSLTAMASSTFVGPLPPPGQLKAYNEIVPGSAERMLAMAERQAAHRQELERDAVMGGSRRSWLGLWLGFAIAVIVLALGGLLVLTDHDAAGTILMGVDLVALSGVFVYGRLDQRKERVEKAKHATFPATGPPPPEPPPV